MSLKLKKEELEIMSNKEIATLILKDSKRPLKTADLYKKIIKLLELPESTFEKKIGDFYTQLATDKNFILLDDGKWDLRTNHKSDKTIVLEEDSDDEEEESEEEVDEIEEDNYTDDEEEDYVDDSTDEDLKDLVIMDEDEMELDN